MKKAVVVYQSKTGRTQKLGEEIGKYLTSKGFETNTIPVTAHRKGLAESADVVLLGCWTAGLMLLFQHPDKVWGSFAQSLPLLKGKTGLFTTYRIATGSMFKSMRKRLTETGSDFSMELKSKSDRLSDAHKKLLDGLVD